MTHRLSVMNPIPAIAAVDHPGDAIRERRIELGWTQSELAQRTGVPQADISRIENHHLDPRWSTVHRLATALSEPTPPKRSLANGGRRTPPRPPSTSAQRLNNASQQPSTRARRGAGRPQR